MSWADVVAQREARPGLLGVELEPYPYLSAYGLLLRVTRLSALEPGERFRTLGLRHSNQSVLADLKAGRVGRARFESAMGVARTRVPDTWSEEVWSPLQTDGALDRLVRPVRTCFACSAHGYHTSLFQLPSILRCPWHDHQLNETCVVCHEPAHGRFDDAGRLGVCSCGHDSFRVNTATVSMWTFPTEQAERWLTTYLAWVRRQRESRRLVVYEHNPRWVTGFARLARPTEELAGDDHTPWDVETQLEECVSGATADPPESAFWGWGALGADRPLTFVPLPSGTHVRLSNITQDVIASFSDGTHAPLELVASNGFEARATLQQNAVNRANCFIPPNGRAADGSAWLNVSAVDIGTLRLCGKLIDRVIDGFGAEDDEGDFSHQASRTRVVGRIPGRGSLAEALEQVLCRGFEMGLDALLRLYLGKPAPAKWWLPVAELKGTNVLDGVRLCWIEIPAPRLCRTNQVPPHEPRIPPKGKARKARRAKRRTKCGTKPDRRTRSE